MTPLHARRAARTAVGLALVGCASPTAADDDLEALRARFSEAYFAAATGAELTAADDGAALRAYPIYAYLEAERIATALARVDAGEATAHDADAAAFIDRHAGRPVADVLARARLESLARRGRDAALVEHYWPEVATPELECEWLGARIDTGAVEGLAPAILERWHTPRQLPIECERVFEWLRAEGVLDAAQTEGRVRALLENGRAAFARVIARQLPETRAAPWLVWADLITAPRATLDTLIANPGRAVEFDALLDGFSRLARGDPEAALTRLEPLIAARDLDGRETSLVTRALAYGLAWDRDARALEYFERVAARHLDDYTLQWRTRAALWSGDWQLAAASIEALSASARTDAAWRYWAARAAEALGDTRRARSMYDALRADDNFYAALAAARLERAVTPQQQRLARDGDTLETLRRLEPMVRARELRAVDLPAEALAEWRHAQAGLEPAATRQSIHVAADWGWYDVAVATATRLGIYFDYELLYPRPYARSVAAASRRTSVDAPLVYGIVRQESLFRADAASPAGALGLMQLVPETAARTARRWNLTEPDRGALLEPATNLELGAAHVRDLVERFGGQLPPALAAYNAGAAAVEGWLPAEPVAADVWIENIPYNETRAYVRRVMWHSLVFKWLDEREPQSTAAWLTTIEAGGAAAGPG